MPLNIAAILRHHRHALSLSQSAMAELLGCSVRTYEGWELGRHKPRGRILETVETKLSEMTLRNAKRLQQRHGKEVGTQLNAVLAALFKNIEVCSLLADVLRSGGSVAGFFVVDHTGRERRIPPQTKRKQAVSKKLSKKRGDGEQDFVQTRLDGL